MRRFLSASLSLFLTAGSLWAQEGTGLDASAEYFNTGDIQILDSSLGFRHPAQSMEWRASLGSTFSSIDYQPNAPIDPFGFNRSRGESIYEGQASLAYRTEQWEVSGNLSASDGFRNYSSVWLDEYYRQQYGMGGIPGVTYREPDPHSYGLGLGLAWEYLPATATLSLNVAYLRERIAPGYEIEDLVTSFALVRGVEDLDIASASLTWEAVLSPSWRTRQVVSVTDTTGRDLRYSLSSAAIWAFTDTMTLRGDAAYAREGELFEAWSAELSYVVQLTGTWSISLSGRLYEDTGQIEQANLVSSAAPALHTRSLLLSLRRGSSTANWFWLVEAGPYQTDYGATGIGTDRFALLYRDRDWLRARAALSYRF